jgi:hypothetical protein
VSRRIVYSLLLASVCLAVLATRVSPGFDRTRFLVVTAPRLAQQPVLSVALPDLTRLSGAPAAVVVRLRGTTEPATVAIALDAAHVKTVTVPPGREIRVDAPTLAPAGAGHQLILTGDRTGWQLAYMEIANVYGFSHGTLKFVIVPRERPRDPSLPWWGLLLFAIVAVAAYPAFDWPHSRGPRRLHRAVVGLVLTLFAVSLLADTFTGYRVVFLLETFLLLAALLYLEPLVRLWGVMRPYVYAVFPRVAPYFPHVAVLGIVLSGVGQFYKPDTGFTSLIMFGEQFESSASAYLQRTPHAVDRGSGYDGQFYAQIALDPLLRSRSTLNALDSAPYRGRRILLPWVSHLAGFGQPWFVLQAYALVNVACWIGLALLLLRWLPAGQLRAVFAWIACMLSDGLLSSMRQSLPDGPSMLLLALGVAAAEQQRRNAAAGLLGLAGLARETNLLGAVILIPDRLTMGEVARFAGRLAIAVAPLLLWVGYLWYRGMPPDDRGHRNFAPVFSEFIDKWVTTVAILRADGWDSFARFSLVALIGLTTQLAVLLWQRDWRNLWWRMGIAYAALMVVLGPAVWEGQPGAVTRVAVPMAIAFNILVVKSRWFWPLWLLGNAGIIHGVDFMRLPWLSGW